MDKDETDSGDAIARGIAMHGAPAGADAGELHKRQTEFLHAQTGLLELRREKLKAELKSLHSEDRNSTIAGIRERLKLVLDVGLASVGMALIAIVGMLVWSAARSQSVVVDAFSVPPDFAAQGNTGVMVAGGFLDRLQALQSATRSSAKHHDIEDAWSNNIKIDIPETGISLGDAMGYLRGWLGADIHISGGIVRDGDMIALSVRGSGFPGKSFTGKAGDLPKLITEAAEYSYGQSEPYLYAAYLENSGRDKDALTFVQEIFSTVDQAQRENLLTVWGNALIDVGDTVGGLDKYREEVRLNPRAWIAYNNIINARIVLGDEEGALQTAAQMEQAAGHAGAVSEVLFQNQDYLRMDLPALHHALVADMDATRGLGTAAAADAPLDAEMLERMHQRKAAELELETSPGAGSEPDVISESAFVRALMHVDVHDLVGAYAYATAADRLFTQYQSVSSSYYAPPVCPAGWLAEMIGQKQVADADIKRGGHFEDCYRAKADIADHRGNWDEAQKDYVAAVALAPSMPNGYFSWGNALMRHRQYRAAIAKFAQATEKSPHWADPLKRNGDALVTLNRSDLALVKYADAAKFAPRWGALYIAWGRALDYLGRRDDARDKYKAALGMDLTGDEHWSLRGCCG